MGRFDKEAKPVFSCAALCHLRGVWSADAMERSIAEETFRDTLVRARSHAPTDIELEFSSALVIFTCEQSQEALGSIPSSAQMNKSK